MLKPKGKAVEKKIWSWFVANERYIVGHGRTRVARIRRLFLRYALLGLKDDLIFFFL